MSGRTLAFWLVVAGALVFNGQRLLHAAKRPPFLAVDTASLAPDSVTLSTRFRPTLDRYGDTVAGFRWRVFTGRAPYRVEILRGYVRLDTLVLVDGRVVLRWRVGTPYPGDSIDYSYSLRAVDRQGIPSAEVWSGYTRLLGAWGPPAPLIIPIDTTTTGVPPDSIQLATVDVAALADTLRLAAPGDTLSGRPHTVQLCVIVWRNGERFMARELAPACYERVSIPVWQQRL